MGQKFRDGLASLQSPLIREIRGRGLLNAIDLHLNLMGRDARGQARTPWHVCLLMARGGLLAKPTHTTTIRLAPPLCISADHVKEAVEIVGKALQEIVTVESVEELEAAFPRPTPSE